MSPARNGGSSRCAGLVDPVIAGHVHHLSLQGGKSQWFSDAGADDQGRLQCVLGAGMAQVLGGDVDKASLEPGDVFSMHDRQWVVTGVMNSAGSAFDSEVWCKQQLVEQYFGKKGYTTGVLSTPDDATARARPRTPRQTSRTSRSRPKRRRTTTRS